MQNGLPAAQRSELALMGDHSYDPRNRKFTLNFPTNTKEKAKHSLGESNRVQKLYNLNFHCSGSI
jgi:hypothetical protein